MAAGNYKLDKRFGNFRKHLQQIVKRSNAVINSRKEKMIIIPIQWLADSMIKTYERKMDERRTVKDVLYDKILIGIKGRNDRIT